MANLPVTKKQFEAKKAAEIDATAQFTRYDTMYWTYTSSLDDARLPAFINALTQGKPVSFQGKVYFIRRILMCEEKTIIVLKLVK